MVTVHRRTLFGGALALGGLGVLGLAGCANGSSSAQAGSAAIAKTIKITAVEDLTGAQAFAGVGSARGSELAIEEINASGFLGAGVQLVFDKRDPAGEIERATSEVTKAIADKETMVLIGPATGQQAAAVAPLAERGKVPIVFTQAGAEGVVIGDYTFRATAPMYTYYETAVEYLAENNVRTASILYNATFSTLAELGTKHIPEMAAKHGITIVSSVPVQSSTQDFTTPTQQITAASPDAVFIPILNNQAATALKQFKQAGYRGKFMGNTAQAGGNMKEAGQDAVGIYYPVDFSAGQTDEAAKKFTAAFQAKFGELPKAYGAEGYDAIWWIARGIKASGDSSREGIRKGLAQIAGQGFDGAMGAITFAGNDMRVPGKVVQWDGEKETVVKIQGQ
ncbi:ABC transporter substrate-binding protein [Granulicoccus phenolivorans]|uniref:ABC transporter substrate-binding protein n=1 Tax=Granulicoccus phenolivorans TaxID=266854 RepID=UPI0004103A8F|nr:ABC transporter substrate-binding protein [Granulicoccus phenolivorans]